MSQIVVKVNFLAIMNYVQVNQQSCSHNFNFNVPNFITKKITSFHQLQIIVNSKNCPTFHNKMPLISHIIFQHTYNEYSTHSSQKWMMLIRDMMKNNNKEMLQGYVHHHFHILIVERNEKILLESSYASSYVIDDFPFFIFPFHPY